MTAYTQEARQNITKEVDWNTRNNANPDATSGKNITLSVEQIDFL
jgi:hypothetical protein